MGCNICVSQNTVCRLAESNNLRSTKAVIEPQLFHENTQPTFYRRIHILKYWRMSKSSAWKTWLISDERRNNGQEIRERYSEEVQHSQEGLHQVSVGWSKVTDCESIHNKHWTRMFEFSDNKHSSRMWPFWTIFKNCFRLKHDNVRPQVRRRV